MTTNARILGRTEQSVDVTIPRPVADHSKGPVAKTTATRPADDQVKPDRASPDPCRHTDRYRLVTPFSLRL
jgi:hypothetical protein